MPAMERNAFLGENETRKNYFKASLILQILAYALCALRRFTKRLRAARVLLEMVPPEFIMFA